MKSRDDIAVIAYVPTPHAGYLKFFRSYPGEILYLFGEEFIKEFPSLVRHLPGVTPEEAQLMIRATGIFAEVHILTPTMLDVVRHMRIVMPDEDVTHAFVGKYLGVGARVIFDGRWRLRWDWGATQKQLRPGDEQVVSEEEFGKFSMSVARIIAGKSPDWWRQIGAILIGEKVNPIFCFNRHVPSDQSAYCNGDPRSNFEPGEHIDVSCALHAEAGVIAEAAKRGVSTEGCDLWVTTFPCPPCAYLIAYSGIRHLYYADGYARLEGAEVLKSKGVEILRVVRK